MPNHYHRNRSYIVNNNGQPYKVEMVEHSHETNINLLPIFVPEQPKDPVNVKSEDETPEQLILAIAIAIALMLIILGILIILCCCCAGCPVHECRRRRRKKRRLKRKEKSWKMDNEPDFIAPMFEPQTELTTLSEKKPISNGQIAPLDDVKLGKTQKFESGAPGGEATNTQLNGTMKPSTDNPWGKVRVDTGTPSPSKPSSIIATSDLNGYSASKTMSETGSRRHLDVRDMNTLSSRTSCRQHATMGVTGIQLIRSLETNAQLQCGHDSNMDYSDEIWWVSSCVVSADSQLLMTGSKRGAPCVWDLKTGSLLHRMNGPDSPSNELKLTSENGVMVGLVADNEYNTTLLQIWDYHSPASIHMNYPVFASAICPLNYLPKVVVAQFDPQSNANPSLVLWDVEANLENRVLPFHHPEGMPTEGGITFLEITSDDRLILAGFRNAMESDSNFMVFDLNSVDNGHIHDPNVVSFQANLDCTSILNGKPEAVTGAYDGSLIIWSLLSGQILRQLTQKKNSVGSAAAHQGEIIILKISKDGKLLVSGDSDGILHFWNSRHDRWQATIQVTQLTSVAVADNSSIVATGSAIGRVCLWNGRSGHQLTEICTSVEITSLILAPDLSSIVALSHSPQFNHMMVLRLIRDHLQSSTLHSPLSTIHQSLTML